MKYPDLIRKQDAELAYLRQKLAEARADIDAKARLIVMQNDELRQQGLQLSMARYEAARARVNGQLQLAAQAAELTAILAERDAKIANLETAVNELGTTMAQVALLESMIPPQVFQALNEATKIADRVVSEPMPTYSEYRAVLRECRAEIADDLVGAKWDASQAEYKSRVDEFQKEAGRLQELLNRIDAIIGKDER